MDRSQFSTAAIPSCHELCGLTKHLFIVSPFCRSEVRALCASTASLLRALQGWNQGVTGCILSGGSVDKSPPGSFRLMVEFRTKFPVFLLPVGWGNVLGFQKLHAFLGSWPPSCIFKASSCGLNLLHFSTLSDPVLCLLLLHFSLTLPWAHMGTSGQSYFKVSQ